MVYILGMDLSKSSLHERACRYPENIHETKDPVGRAGDEVRDSKGAVIHLCKIEEHLDIYKNNETKSPKIILKLNSLLAGPGTR